MEDNLGGIEDFLSFLSCIVLRDKRNEEVSRIMFQISSNHRCSHHNIIVR